MSDSLKATVIVIVLASMISAKPVLELLELLEPLEPVDPVEPLEELPRLPAVVPLAPLVPEEELELDAPLVALLDPPDTASPGEALDSEAIVPLEGAYSFVLASAVSALLTLDSAL